MARNPLQEYARYMLKKAMRAQPMDDIHAAGMRKAEQAKRSVKPVSSEVKDMTAEQKRMSITASAFVGLLFAMTLGQKQPEKYPVKSEGAKEALRNLWADLLGMPDEAKQYVIKSLLSFKSPALEERFQAILTEAGIEIGKANKTQDWYF